MSQNITQTPLPAIDRQAPFAQQVQGVVARMRVFLAGRAKSCLLPLDTTNTRSPLELTPSAKDGSQPQNSFSRSEVRSIAMQVVAIMYEKPSPSDVRDRVPSYALSDKVTNANLADLLALTYTPSKGNNADVELNAAGHCVSAYRREVGRLAKKNKLAATVKAGAAFYGNADAIIKAKLPQSRGIKAAFAKQVQAALLDKNGDPRPFPSEKKAKNTVCRAIFGDGWYETDKADRHTLAAKFVYAQADSVGKADQGRVNRAATSTLDDLSPAALRALAKKAGAPKRTYTGKGATQRARAWFAADVKRIAVLNE